MRKIFIPVLVLILCARLGTAPASVFYPREISREGLRCDLQSLVPGGFLSLEENGEGTLRLGTNRAKVQWTERDGRPEVKGPWGLEGSEQNGEMTLVSGEWSLRFVSAERVRLLKPVSLAYGPLTVDISLTGMQQWMLLIFPEGTVQLTDLPAGESLRGEWGEDGLILRNAHGQVLEMENTGDMCFVWHIDGETSVTFLPVEDAFEPEVCAAREIWCSPEEEGTRVLVLYEDHAALLTSRDMLEGTVRGGEILLEDGETVGMRIHNGEMILSLPEGEETVLQRLVDVLDMDLPFEKGV